MTMAELEKELLKLSEAEKKQLLRRLIADLDAGSDGDVDRAWLEEAQRRYQELKSGVVKPIPAEDAIAGARERLKRARRASSGRKS